MYTQYLLQPIAIKPLLLIFCYSIHINLGVLETDVTSLYQRVCEKTGLFTSRGFLTILKFPRFLTSKIWRILTEFFRGFPLSLVPFQLINISKRAGNSPAIRENARLKQILL
jgi:hypothetical protein